MKVNKKTLALLLMMGLSTYPYIDRVLEDNVQIEEENQDETKIICKFRNIYKMDEEDIISILNNKNEVVAILGVEKGYTNDTFIRLGVGKYRVYSKSGFDQVITITSKNTFLLELNYLNKKVNLKEYKNTITSYKESLENTNDDINYISSDLDFNKEYVDSNVDYSEISKDEYTSQGYTIVGGTYPSILISAYKEDELSRIYVYERDTGKYLGYIILNNKNHVGGLTYDPTCDILFITGSKGSINTYDYSTLMKTLNNASDITDDVHIDLSNEINNKVAIMENDINVDQQAATITYFDGSLYSIDFGFDGVLVKTDYNLVNNKVITTNNTYYKLNNSKCVQGISFYQKDDEVYLVLSSSLGIINSKLTLYKLVDKNFEYLCELTLDSNKKMEGISIDRVGNISSIYEGSEKSEIVSSVDELIDLNNNDIVNNIMYDISGFTWDMFHDDGIKVKRK